MAEYPVTISERAKLGVFPSDAAGYRFVHGAAVTLPQQRLGLRSTLSYRFRPGVALRSTLRLHESVTSTAIYHMRMRERTLALKGVFTSGIVVKLSARLALHSSLRASLGVKLRERLALAQRQSLSLTFALALRSGLKLRDTTHLGIGAIIREALRVSERLDRTYAAIAAVTDVLVIQDHLGRQLRVVVTHTDGVEIAERDIERMILAGRLEDGMSLSMGFYDPGDDTTTWAVNARTGAVTEYTAYGFNSFAKMGTGYIAAGDDGLYELVGDDDAGEPIVADMISGLMEMTGSNLTSIRAAYLAVRGPGEWYLKLTSDEDRSTLYRVLTRSLTTARVDIGKGWRARYFNFQLVSTGQDFDLQGIEFLPVASVRRI